MSNLMKWLVVGSVLCVSLPAPHARATSFSNWNEITVGHVHLVSALNEQTTREIARQLEAFDETVGRLLQSDDGMPDLPTDIYILDHQDFLSCTVGRRGLGGMFVGLPYRNIMTIDASMPPKMVNTTLFHEYTHFIQRNSTSKSLPPWYEEGYAELFSSFDLDKETITVGEPPSGVVADPEHWIPMERLLVVDKNDPEYRSETLAPQFYGESWVLVHYLMFDDTALNRSTSIYLEHLDVGLDEADAFSKAFPFSKQDLDAKLKSLISGRGWHVRKMTLAQSPAVDNARVTRMTKEQAFAALLRAAFMFDRPAKVLNALRSDVLKRFPHEPEIVALNARVAARFGEAADLGDLPAQLLAARNADYPQLRIDVAATLLMRAAAPEKANGNAGPEMNEAAAILDDLVHGKDPPVEAVALWASAKLDTDPALAAAVLTPLTARAPRNTEILRELARVSEKLGDLPAARGYYDRIILVSDRPEERSWAQKHSDSPGLH